MSKRAEKRAEAEVRRWHREDKMADKKSLQRMAARITELETALEPVKAIHMPLLERLRKGANCVGFLDGVPEPAADVADMLRKAADEIERLRAALKEAQDWARDPERPAVIIAGFPLDAVDAAIASQQYPTTEGKT